MLLSSLDSSAGPPTAGPKLVGPSGFTDETLRLYGRVCWRLDPNPVQRCLQEGVQSVARGAGLGRGAGGCTGLQERRVVTVSALGGLVPGLPSACDAHSSSAPTVGRAPGHIPSWPKGGDTTAWRGDPSSVPRRCGVRRHCLGAQAHPAPWGGERASWGPWCWQTSNSKGTNYAGVERVGLARAGPACASGVLSRGLGLLPGRLDPLVPSHLMPS